MSFIIVVRIIIFRSRKCRVVLHLLRVSFPWLVLNGTETSLMGSLSKVKCCFTLKARSRFRESELGMSASLRRVASDLVAGIGQSLALQVDLLSVIATFERVIDRIFMASSN